MRKYLLPILIFVFTSTYSQSISFEFKAAPCVTIPINKAEKRFWNFEEDAGITNEVVESKRKPKFGVFLSPNISIVFKGKKKSKFVLSTGANYYYKSYGYSWTSNYQKNGIDGLVNVEYAFKRHDVGLHIMPGFTYRGLIVTAGLNFLFIINSELKAHFFRNGISLIDTVTHSRELFKSSNNTVFNMAIPVVVSYDISFGGRIYMSPFLNLEFGVYDIDGYALGSMNRRIGTMLSQMSIGVSIKYKK